MISGFHLWLALIGLYLLESVRLTPAGTMLFIRRFSGRSWYGLWPWGGPTAARSWFLLPPVPGSEVILAQDFVLACDSERLAANSAFVPGDARIHLWQEIEVVGADDHDVLVNTARFLSCPSAAQARFTADRMRGLRATAKEDRPKTILEMIRAAFAPGARKEADLFQNATKSVRLLSAALWVVAFPILGLALLIVNNDSVLLPVLLMIELLGLAVAVATVRAKKRLSPPGKRRFAWWSLKYVFYPIAALRAQDDLAEGLLQGVHPAALCLELCDGEHRTTLLRNLLRRMRYPSHLSRYTDAGEEELSDAVSDAFNAHVLAEAEAALAKMCPEVLKTAIPEREHVACRYWCPRCEAQYRVATGDCADCPGVKLRPFEASDGVESESAGARRV